jgi:hypothetical protein
MAQTNSNYQPTFEHIQRLVETYLNLTKLSCIHLISSETNSSEDVHQDAESVSEFPSNATLKAIYNLVIHHVMNTKGPPTSHNAKFPLIDNRAFPTLDLVVDGYAILIFATVGIILNITGMFVLLRKSGLRTLFNLLLSSIVAFDSIYLAFKIFASLQDYILPFSTNYLGWYYLIRKSGERFSFISSVLLLIALGHSRYEAVRNPFKHRQLTLSSKKRRDQFLKYLLLIVFIAILFTLPVTLEIEFKSNETSEDKLYQEVLPSELRLNPYYSLFLLGVLNIGLLGVLPLGSLLYYTIQIIMCTNKSRIETSVNNINYSNQVIHQSRGRIKVDRMSKTLFIIILAFFVLHFLRIISYVGEFVLLFLSNKNSYCLQLGFGIPKWLQVIAILSNLCTVIGASINTIIYNCANSPSLINTFPSCISHCYQYQNPTPSEDFPLPPLPTKSTRSDTDLQNEVITNKVCQDGDVDETVNAQDSSDILYTM